MYFNIFGDAFGAKFDMTNWNPLSLAKQLLTAFLGFLELKNVFAILMLLCFGGMGYLGYLLSQEKEARLKVESDCKNERDDAKAYYDPIVGALQHKIDSLMLDRVTTLVAENNQLKSIDSAGKFKDREIERLKKEIATIQQLASRNRKVVNELTKEIK